MVRRYTYLEGDDEKDLTEFPEVKRWITRLAKKGSKPDTLRAYQHALEQYCAHTRLSPTQLIEQRKRDLRDPDRAIQRRAEESLDEWFGVLSKTISSRTHKVLSRNTCVLRYSGIRSFYKANYYDLKVEDAPEPWNEKAKPELLPKHYGRLVQAARHPMHKAYILCQVQSGLGVSDLLRITPSSSEASVFGNVRTQLKSDADHIHLRTFRTKEKKVGYFDSFFGRMATQALREWLKKTNPKPTTPLFPCTRRNINDALGRISGPLGAALPWPITSHNLRMYFNTTLKMTRLNDPAFNDSLIEYWMGHSLGRVKGAYMAPPVTEQLKLYKSAEHRLEPVIDPKFKRKKRKRRRRS